MVSMTRTALLGSLNRSTAVLPPATILVLIARIGTVLRDRAIRTRPVTVNQTFSLAGPAMMRSLPRVRFNRSPNNGRVRSGGGRTTGAAGGAGGREALGSAGGGSEGGDSGGPGGFSGGKVCIPVVGPGVKTEDPDQ